MALLVLRAQGLYGETLEGRVTECATTAGARAHVVMGFEEVTVGLRDLGRPCTIVTDTSGVGVVTTSTDGSYSITYQPTEFGPESRDIRHLGAGRTSSRAPQPGSGSE
jgi:hypothetical protein